MGSGQTALHSTVVLLVMNPVWLVLSLLNPSGFMIRWV